MIVASLLFAFMGVCIKLASASFTSAEMICYRGLIGMAFMWGFARIEGVSLRTEVPRMHLWRSVVGMLALGTWFYAIAHLPLGTANALNYMSSIWIALFVVGASLMTWIPGRSAARAPIDGSLLLSVATGFVGVSLLLRPVLPSHDLLPGLVGLLSGLIAALAYMQVITLARVGEPETRTVFYFALGCAAGGAIWMGIAGVSSWSWPAAVWLVPIGVLASLGQWCMTRAYSDTSNHSSILVVANLQYTGILFSALLGYLVFEDDITMHGWIGMSAIIASGVAATVILMRITPSTRVEEC